MGFAAVMLRPVSLFYLGLVCCLFVAVVSCLLMLTTGFWVAWVTFVLVEVPVGIGWSVMWYGAQRRRDRKKVPDHTLVKFVAKGSYGEVWLARNAIGAYHAAKIVYRQNFETRSPFDREFRGVKQFMPISRMHPGWVPILHVGRNDEDGFFYYVMEAADDEAHGSRIVPESYSPMTLAGELQKRKWFPLNECTGRRVADEVSRACGP